jgi:hypothetical protein
MGESTGAPCGRPSMVGRVAAGAGSWTSVDLVVVGNVGHEGVAIRAGLEEMGVRVNLFRVGQARHLVDVLSGREGTAPYAILDSHGDEGRFVLPQLDSAVAAGQPFDGYLGPAELGTFVRLPGRVVISLGCTTGAEPLARAFLNGGCDAYIGPDGAPYGYGSVFFPLFLFYELTNCRPLAEAVERVRAHDAEMALFRLYGRAESGR